MKNPSMKISPYEKYITITKQKQKYYDCACVVNCTCKLFVCVPVCVHAIARVSGNSMNLSKLKDLSCNCNFK